MNGAREITAALRGHWYGGYGLAFCPAHDNTRTPALTLNDGDDGQLLVSCKAGCKGRDVLAALRRLGLLDGHGAPFVPDLAAQALRRAREAQEAARRRDQARRIWTEAQPVTGTLAERYLRNRGITCPLPPTLRFAPNCWHGATARRLPALVAAVTMAGRNDVMAVHRTYLAEPGRKAPVEPAKAMLAAVAGGAVRLSGGPGPLAVAEGIETALALLGHMAAVLPGLSPSMWAGLSAPGVAGLRLPDTPGELFVAPDGDPAGRAAADELARRAWASGWRVRIIPPPGDKLDWADITVGTVGTVEGRAA